jgi:hypothetical protein
MTTAKTLYWLFVGALFGIGVVGILSIGIFLLVPAIALLIFGAIRFGGKGLWAGLVGFGAAPAALLIWDVTSQPWACQPADGVTSSPIIHGGTATSPNYFSCVSTPIGQLTSYHVLAAGFGAIAFVGLLLGLGVWLFGRRRPQRPTSQLAA